MSKIFGQNVNFNLNETIKQRVENILTFPSLTASDTGYIFYHVGQSTFYGWNGISWLNLGSSGGSATLDQVLANGNTSTRNITVGNIAGNIITARGNDALRILGDNNGLLNRAYLSFWDQDGSTRRGAVGKMLNDANGVMLVNDSGGQLILAGGGGLNGVKYFPGTGTNTYDIYHAGNLSQSQLVVPPGGTTGQVLTKDSETNYHYSWKTVSGGGGTAQTLAQVLNEGNVANINGSLPEGEEGIYLINSITSSRVAAIDINVNGDGHGINIVMDSSSTGYGIGMINNANNENASINITSYGAPSLHSNYEGADSGIYSVNYSTGNGIVSNGFPTATGYNYVGQNAGADTFTVTKEGFGFFAGRVTGQDPIGLQDFVTKGYADTNYSGGTPNLDDVLTSGNVSNKGMAIDFMNINNVNISEKILLRRFGNSPYPLNSDGGYIGYNTDDKFYFTPRDTTGRTALFDFTNLISPSTNYTFPINSGTIALEPVTSSYMTLTLNSGATATTRRSRKRGDVVEVELRGAKFNDGTMTLNVNHRPSAEVYVYAHSDVSSDLIVPIIVYPNGNIQPVFFSQGSTELMNTTFQFTIF